MRLRRQPGSRHFVAEVDVPGGVNQIENVILAVLRHVLHPRRLRLDGDTALALNVHRVEDLSLHIALGDGLCVFQKAISQSRLAVVDVGDDRKVADEIRVCWHWIPTANAASQTLRAREVYKDRILTGKAHQVYHLKLLTFHQ